ncbi:hypothetical protein FB566_1883 [Stackebrandtia endophytica]|uniref:Uncharacterized protein n=1 Tax=Stackebrandtia endophytica TaxID=1496996 RepID=A0A543AUT8_9ACTN|nr:hypothetical protein FB566_1883 [Stackebrandtia endophytica]
MCSARQNRFALRCFCGLSAASQGLRHLRYP